MRLAAYAGTSVALAAGIFLKALHSRPNFYSVCVYFAESNAALMILSNLVLLVIGSMLVGLQHVLYGPLRPIEIEQLYEKAWFAVTETCLAMTIFREELGVWFVVMFVSLLVAKVWGWIGEGRLEILEQQPPENPKMFHVRLSASLILSMIFNIWLLNYSVDTVRQTNRPNMMVMFAFEFALLNVSSLSTFVRYGVIVQETLIVRDQTNTALQARRKQIEEQRKAARDAAAEAGEPVPEEPPIEELLDEADVDVPGWEEKSRWLFYLDLTTDFLRLLLYVTFFCVLCRLYGMPIHIIRDVALVVRSFYRRVTDFIKYRHATRDMHARYPDATEQEIASQDVCIICREAMQARTEGAAQAPAEATPTSPQDERLRPKKLPCGHILHFACLRSWLERQQNCPTCRQPVLSTPTTTQSTNPANPGNPQAGGAQPARNNNQAPQGNQNQPHAQLNRMRTFNLGPLRLTVGTGQIVRVPQQGPNGQNAGPSTTPAGIAGSSQTGTHSSSTPNSNPPAEFDTLTIQNSMAAVERMLLQQMQSLQLQNEQLNVLRRMQVELLRLRYAQGTQTGTVTPNMGLSFQPQVHHPSLTLPTANINAPPVSVFSAGANSGQLPAGNTNIPAGVTIPEGWTLLPLQRMPESAGMHPIAPMMTQFEQRSRSAGPHRHTVPNPLASVFVNQTTTVPQASTQAPPLTDVTRDASANTDTGSVSIETRSVGQATPIPTQHQEGPTSASTEAQSITSQANPEHTATSNTTEAGASSTSNWQWPSSPPLATPTTTSVESTGDASSSNTPAANKSHSTTVEDVPDEE